MVPFFQRVRFDFEKIWEYCALEAHKAAYTSLKPDEQEAVRVSARERICPSGGSIKYAQAEGVSAGDSE